MKAGAGINIWNMPLKRLIKLLYVRIQLTVAKSLTLSWLRNQWVNTVSVLYYPAIFFTKLSILLQYSKIFTTTMNGKSPMVIAIRTCICTNFLYYLITMFFRIFQCIPRERIWNPFVSSGYCYSPYTTEKASGVFNVISDFTILVLPLPSVWRLQMSIRKKLSTTAVFAVGIL